MKALRMTEKPMTRLSVRIGVMSALLLAGGWSIAADEQAFIRDHASADIEWGPCPAFMPDSCGLAVLQGDPRKENTDVLFRLRSDTTAPHHWHTSAERMILLSGKMRVDYDNQEPVVMEQGTYAYGPPELPHVATCQSEEDCVLFISFDNPVDAFAVDE
ncbi:cupin domain-containing protein [Pseudomonas sp. OIL-1]|uniref:cupin domain-containing protein n=1 Tax=Pseudomonas sp. OIL-1 TaxID=2706126 RepID=UPI001C499B98|nr:cupin domain-containing protein [Pseudomonas sp. OIL-1]